MRDFNDLTENRPFYVSLLMNNEKSKSINNSDNKFSEKRKLSNSAILKKWSEYEDSIDKSLSPLKGEQKSVEDNEKNKTFDEINESEIYEIQDIEVMDSLQKMRNGKNSRVCFSILCFHDFSIVLSN